MYNLAAFGRMYFLHKKVVFTLWACCLVISCTQSNPAPAVPSRALSASASAGGARIDKPISLAVSGAECFSGKGKNAGDVAFGFPSRGPNATLKFTIGPLRDGLSPGQENNKPYAGPGDYPNVGMVLQTGGTKPLAGYAIITVNADEKSGAFRLPDGSASGTWDCGHKLER